MEPNDNHIIYCGNILSGLHNHHHSRNQIKKQYKKLSETISLQVSNTTELGQKRFKSRNWLKSQNPMFVKRQSC